MSAGGNAGIHPNSTHAPRKAASLPKSEARSPLAQLLHALNQPLTGLQCSMEVALASPRTAEQYVRGLREGLELAERMRALVEAIREVADGEGEVEENAELETIEWKTVLGEVLDDLKPVAEVKNVRITLDGSAASSLAVKAGRRRLSSLVFRSLESALSLADRGSALKIEMGGEEDVAGGVAADVAAGEAWIRIRWHAGPQPSAFSRPELGWLVAQAGWERAGAKWERERAGNLETVTIRLPSVVPAAGDSK
jgi:signal transduction histidine kinase